eukprot:03905_5
MKGTLVDDVAILGQVLGIIKKVDEIVAHQKMEVFSYLEGRTSVRILVPSNLHDLPILLGYVGVNFRSFPSLGYFYCNVVLVFF